jgi:hypothetical protein
MEATRNTVETNRGPAEWFTGTVFIDTIAAPAELPAVGAASVHLTPGARTAWHTHPHGRTIWVTEASASASGTASPRVVDLDGYRAMNDRDAVKVLVKPRRRGH